MQKLLENTRFCGGVLPDELIGHYLENKNFPQKIAVDYEGI